MLIVLAADLAVALQLARTAVIIPTAPIRDEGPQPTRSSHAEGPAPNRIDIELQNIPPEIIGIHAEIEMEAQNRRLQNHPSEISIVSSELERHSSNELSIASSTDLESEAAAGSIKMLKIKFELCCYW